MKVLFVAPLVPWPLDCGGRIRTFKLLRELSRLAEVHFRGVRQPGLDGNGVRELENCCASVRVFERRDPNLVTRFARAKRERWFFSSELRDELEREVATSAFDLVHLDEMVLVRMLPRNIPVPVIVHHHKLDVLVLEGSRGVVRHVDGLKLARLEALSARASRHHVVCSDVDARALGARYPELSIGVVPSGFDPNYLRPGTSGSARSANTLLFLGAMSYDPNVDGATHLVREILPRIHAHRPDVELEIVGPDPAPQVRALAGPAVRVVGAVRDVRPYLDRAALLAAPLRIGSGTRLKLVDALACHCPVVATSIAAEGIAFRHEEHLEIADGAEAFARAVVSTLSAPDRAAERARAGAEFAHSRYRWDQLARALLESWRSAANSRSIATLRTA